MKQKKIANFMTAMILFGNMGTTIAHANPTNTTLEQNAETNIEKMSTSIPNPLLLKQSQTLNCG